MKRHLAVILLIAISVSLGHLIRVRCEEPPPEFLLAEQRIGVIRIGSTVDDLLERYGKSNTRLVDLNLEGGFSPAIEVDIEGNRTDGPSLIAGLLT